MKNSKYLNIISSKDDISTLPLRLVGGTIFAAHGAQKLFAWFGRDWTVHGIFGTVTRLFNGAISW